MEIIHYLTMVRFILTIIICTFSSFIINAQVFYSNGSLIHINNGLLFHSNGGVVLSNTTQLTNNGTMTITKNSVLYSIPGNFEIDSNSVVSGDGKYSVEQDWVNNAVFNGDNSEVILFGDKEQFITTDNATVTQFNNLTLTGNGSGVDRRKSLLNVNSLTGPQGILNLNDRELNTNSHIFTVENNVASSIINSTTYNDEGFVSSVNTGYLIRRTNFVDKYLFPVGSSDGTRRYRPVTISPQAASDNKYAVRFNNYIADYDNYFITSHEGSIGEVNSLFYHSIERISGTSNADVEVFFIPSVDNDWKNLANWKTAASEWKNILATTNSTSGNFKNVSKIDWNFPVNDNAYVLENIDYKIVISEVISPNQDGENDYFVITGLDAYPNSEVWIFNRWGTEVFHSDDYQNDWDGTSQSSLNISGDNLPEGTYYYVLNLGGTEEQTNSGETYKGFIYLKR